MHFPVPPVDTDYAPKGIAPLRKRLLSLRAAAMLARNTVVSCAVFVLGLILLWLMVEEGGVNKYLAATTSFVASNTTHYAVGRWWIFGETDRGVGTGLVYFLVTAGLGLAVTMAMFALFADFFGMNYLIARAVASLFAGLAMFATNATFNFRSL